MQRVLDSQRLKERKNVQHEAKEQLYREGREKKKGGDGGNRSAEKEVECSCGKDEGGERLSGRSGWTSLDSTDSWVLVELQL